MCHQASVETIEDEDTSLHAKVVPKNPSRILELSDGSDDDDGSHGTDDAGGAGDYDNMPQLMDVDSDSEDEEDILEKPAESADAELSTSSNLRMKSVSKKII